MIINQILSFFENYTPIIAFLGAILGGEETLIVLAILAAQGFLNIWSLLLFFYLGAMVSDLIWFSIGKSPLFSWLIKKKFISKALLGWEKILNKTTKKNDFQALFFTKFLYGTRIITLMYLSKKRLHLKSFLGYISATNIIWILAILLLGWLAGKGISLAANISNNIILFLFLIGVILIIFTISIRILSNIIKIWLKKKQKQLK